MIDDNIRDLCRICVERSEDYIRIYDQVVPDNTPFFHLINDVCQLDISEDDGFPEYVCKECFLKISEFMVFKRMSHEAKLNLLSLTVTLAEVSPPKEVAEVNTVTSIDNNVSVVDNSAVVDNEAMVATNIIVKQMTGDGITLNVAQPGDIMEEVITMPFVVDYEEVVTADSYTLGNGHVFGEEVTQEEVLLAPMVVDPKRNSKEREVAIILADGGSARVEQQEKAATPVQDTGQVGKQKEVVEINEEEESEALKRRSFIAQAYYRSYLQQKKKSEEGTVRGEEEGISKEGDSQGAELREEDDSQECEDAVAAISEEMEEDPGSPANMDVSEAEQSQEPTAEAVSQESEEVSSNAVCCKKKMLAISKSLELSRGASKAESGVAVDEPTEASGDREGAEKAGENSRMSKSEGEALALITRSKTTKPVDSNGVKPAEGVQIKADTSSSVRTNRGVCKGPRFNLSKDDTLVPPKNRKEQSGREEASDSSQALIQVIASEELASKVQQFDLEQQVGDILKTSLSGKKKIQVSEVGPTGNVFHVEPTIVKLKGMLLTGGRNNRIMPYGTRAASKKGRVNVVWEEGGSEKESKEVGATNSAVKKVEGRGRGRPRRGPSVVATMEIPGEPSTPPAAMGSEAIAILRNRAPKTLLLTAPMEDNTDAQTPLAILLRPLKQEREEVEGPEGAALQRECFVEVKQEVLSDTEESPGAQVPQGDPESFVNHIRLRAKRAMIKCMKRKLNELERMQQGQPEAEENVVYLSEDAEEEVEVQTTEEGEPSEPIDLVDEDTPLYTCVHCGQSSYSKAEMSWHMKQAHEADKQPQGYFCEYCDVCFTKRYMYRLHMEMHELMLDGEVVEEDSVTTAAAEQEDGKAATTESSPPPTSLGRRSKPYKCRFCNASFKGKAATLYHEACKHKSAPLYPCTNCTRKFLSQERMEDHLQQCCGNRIECEVCHKNYSMSSIVTHMRTHQKEKPYLCAECGKTFSQQGDLKRHTKHFHLGIEPARPFLCSYCPKTFSAQSKLRIHERSHTKEKPYECSDCGKGFGHLASLRKHKENREVACLPVIKNATKPYTCSVCKKGWDHKYGLSKHIAWVHERKRPSRTFHCQLCPKVYYCRSQLTYHERTHTKEKPFVCSVCDKGFAYNSLRKIHMDKEHGLRIGSSDAPR